MSNLNTSNPGRNNHLAIVPKLKSLTFSLFVLLCSSNLIGQDQKVSNQDSRHLNSSAALVGQNRAPQTIAPALEHGINKKNGHPGGINGTNAITSIIECPSGNCNPNAKAAYLSSLVFGEPWFTTDNEVAMDQAFGAGNWDALFFESVDINVLLSGDYNVIFLDGSDRGAIALSNFLSINLPAIEAWVAGGGALLLNAAPNEGVDIDFGFGGFLLDYDMPADTLSMDGIVIVPGHPVFNGPAIPASGNFMGNYFSHGVVRLAGAGATELILNTWMSGASLVEFPYGSGTVLFGSMTVPFYHTPLPNASNFRANLLSYLDSKTNCIQFEFQTDVGLCTHTITSDTLDATLIGNNPGATLFHDFASAPNSSTLIGAQLLMGTTTIIWTAIDAAGVSSTCSVTVTVYNNAIEVCNGLDDDCDGLVDESGGQTWYADADGDGFGDPVVDSIACTQPFGFVPNNTDCNDLDALVNPNATEICNGFDDNCNGLVDDADPGTIGQAIWYADADADGFGNALVDSASCIQPFGFVSDDTDCDDTNANVNPAANEICNGIDDNCNGQIDEIILTPIIKTTDLSCNGIPNGTITIGVTGGAAPFIYQWSNGETSSDLIGLSAGTYTVTLTDNNQCTLEASANIVEPTPISIGTTQYSISCSGNSDGYIASTVTGGIGPYIYYWSEKSITADIDSLPAGIYALTITDAQGCTATTSASISAPPVLSLEATEVAITCYNAGNGAASAIASGGTGPYNYLWSNGESGTSITNLSPGIYILTATDSKGCTALVSSDITEPPVLSSTINASNASCFGANNGTLTTISAGGTLPYVYQWSNGAANASLNNLPAGAYILTLTDGNGCSGVFSSSISEPALLSVISDAVDINCNGNSNGVVSATGSGGTLPYSYQWSNGASTAIINGLSPQQYTLTLTDGNGCSAKSSATITEPMLLSGLATETDVLCNGGNNGLVSVVCSGGTLPYNYLWSNGSTESQTSGLIAGTYNLTVTDEQGCSKVITSIISDPPLLSVGTSTSNVICHAAANGSVSATTTGGTLPYNYQWSNGDNNPTASGLPSGAYALTVTDGNGCQITTSAFVTQPPLLSLISTGSPVSCNGGANGAVSIIASGGTLPYSYQWSNGSNNPLIVNIPAGTYSIVVTDNNGCTTLLSTSVNEPTLLSSTISTVAVACNGEETGVASATTLGGAPPYQYQWYNGMTSSMVDEIKAGVYTLTITDNNFCTAIETVTITEPPLLSSLADRIDATCRGFTDGSIEILASGGTAPYEYIWSTGDDQAFIENLAAGTYWLTLTDSNGCSLVETVDIIEAHLLTVGLGDDKVLSLGEALELEVASNLNPNEVEQFTWISRTDTLRCKDCASYSDLPLKSGCLTVFVESIYGCTESAAVCYKVESLRRVYVPNAFNPNDDGVNDRLTVYSDASVAKVIQFSVFNRWGEQVYQAQNIQPNDELAGWDGAIKGRILSSEVYVWLAEIEFIDGTKQTYKGDVTVLR
jgi:gliding motility-associated-like protein